MDAAICKLSRENQSLVQELASQYIDPEHLFSEELQASSFTVESFLQGSYPCFAPFLVDKVKDSVYEKWDWFFSNSPPVDAEQQFQLLLEKYQATVP